MNDGSIIVIDGKPYEAELHDSDACGGCDLFNAYCQCPSVCWNDEGINLRFKMLPLEGSCGSL